MYAYRHKNRIKHHPIGRVLKKINVDAHFEHRKRKRTISCKYNFYIKSIGYQAERKADESKDKKIKCG